MYSEGIHKKPPPQQRLAMKSQIHKKLHTVLSEVEDLSLKEHELSSKYIWRKETPLLKSVRVPSNNLY